MSDKAWPRDPKLPFPLTYAHFKGKKPMESHGGKIPYFTITDLPEDRFEDAVDLMANYFSREEPLTKFLKMDKHAESMLKARKDWLGFIQQRCTLVAFADILDENGKPKIAGVNILFMETIEQQDEEEKQVQCGPYGIILECLQAADDKCDCFEKYDVDRYLYAMGLSVNSAYYGQGIGKQLLLAREPLCRRALNCSLTVTIFTAINSQGLAKAAGFEEVAEMDYESFRTHNGIQVFKDLHKENAVKSCLLMAKRF